MNKFVIFGFLVLLLFGCVAVSPITPIKRSGFLIKCRGDIGLCYERATEACGEYEIIHGLAGGKQGGLLSGIFQGENFFERGSLIQMMIKCKQQE